MKKNITLSLLIFLPCFLWIGFLSQGLPVGDPDEWDHLWVAHDVSWKELLINFITPWSTSTAWVGQTDRLNETLHIRIFATIVLKFIESIFGFSPWPLYLFTKAIFFSGTATLLFFLLRQLTQNRWYTLLGLLFYVCVPAHYPHVLWLADSNITIAHFLMILTLTGFLRFHKQLLRNTSCKSLIFSILWIFFSGLIAVKTKEPAVAMPLALTFYCFFYWKRIVSPSSHKWLFIVAVAVLIFQTSLIVPIKHVLSSSTQSSFNFHFNVDTILRMLFRNYDCNYDNETHTAFFSLKQLWPVSIARTFGFFLLWCLIGALFLIAVQKLRKKDRFSKSNPLIPITFLWATIDILFMGFFQPDPRYFSGTMIPLTLLAVRLIQNTIESLTDSLRRAATIVVLFSLTYSLVGNIPNIFYLRLSIGQRSHRFLGFAEKIAMDYFSNPHLSIPWIGGFAGPQYTPKDFGTSVKLGDLIYFDDIGGWNRAATGSLDEFRSMAKQGFIYAVTFNEHAFGNHSDLKNLGAVGAINQASLFERFMYKLKKKKPAPLFILKWSGAFSAGT